MTEFEFRQWLKLTKSRSLDMTDNAPFVIRPEKMLKIIEHIERLGEKKEVDTQTRGE